jgi:hypothetical protein
MAIITLTNVSIVELVNRSVPIQQYEGADDWRYKDGTKLKGRWFYLMGLKWMLKMHKRRYLSILHCSRKMYGM